MSIRGTFLQRAGTWVRIRREHWLSEESLPPCALPELFLNELEDQVDEFIHACGEFFFDGGKVFRFSLCVVTPVLGTGGTPLAGIEWIDKRGGTDEIKGIDHALVIDPALPELMKAVFTFENGNSLVDIHQGALFAGEGALGGFALESIDKHFNFVRPFNGFLREHCVRI